MHWRSSRRTSDLQCLAALAATPCAASWHAPTVSVREKPYARRARAWRSASTASVTSPICAVALDIAWASSTSFSRTRSSAAIKKRPAPRAVLVAAPEPCGSAMRTLMLGASKASDLEANAAAQTNQTLESGRIATPNEDCGSL